jgi:hypothetical protein
LRDNLAADVAGCSDDEDTIHAAHSNKRSEIGKRKAC